MSAKSKSIARTWIVLLAALALGMALQILSMGQTVKPVGSAVVSPAQADINWN